MMNIKFSKKGFSLIELMVAMFILVLVMGAMASIAFSIFQSYQKSKAIKTVTESIGFALSSIAKDVRMGNIDKNSTHSNGVRSDYLLVSRNISASKVCYRVASDSVSLDENISASATSCPSAWTDYKKLVDLSGTGMTFDMSTSGFYSLPTNTLLRGWAEINLNVKMTSGQEMTADQINVQTIVSARDYGWEVVP